MTHKNHYQKQKTKQQRKHDAEVAEIGRRYNEPCINMFPRELYGPTTDGQPLMSRACRDAQYEMNFFGYEFHKKCIRNQTGDLTLKVATFEDWESCK